MGTDLTTGNAEIVERPILFSGGMVRAILGGRKVVTRRVVRAPGYVERKHPDWGEAWGDGEPGSPFGACYLHVPCYGDPEDMPGMTVHRVYPPFEVGDVLWVREGYRVVTVVNDGAFWAGVAYRADAPPPHRFVGIERDVYRDWLARLVGPGGRRWRGAIHMPRWACRLRLRVLDVGVERLQGIDEAGACEEGVGSVSKFRELWDGLNGGRGAGWEVNPWVWVCGFEVVEGLGL